LQVWVKFGYSWGCASVLLAYTQHVQLLGHLFHGFIATILNSYAFKDSTLSLQKGGIVLVGAVVEYKKS